MPRKGSLAIIQGLDELLPGLVQGEIFFPVHVVRMELKLYCFPNDASGFLGLDSVAIK
jgi:hypothetical protein